MKIKTETMSYEKVLSLPKAIPFLPRHPDPLLRAAVRAASASELKAVHFRHREIGMERLRADEPCLILMNHSCFLDLKIAFTIFRHRPFNIVCTSDGFVGKKGLMRRLGCIPTKKFVPELDLLRDIQYCLRTLKTSVLMFPEASYSFDGTATPLPDSLGRCLKHLKAPVVMVRTYGAFLRDPLYNSLQLRDVDVSADVEYLLSPEDIAQKSAEELNGILRQCFTFDYFRWQKENRILVDEPFRADHLNRVLYQCPHCGVEGHMTGSGITLRCNVCGKEYELTEEGNMRAKTGETEISHIPDWYAWEREQVRKEIADGTYRLDVPVKIGVMTDYRAIYMVGEGRLVHTSDGFTLTGCGGALEYTQKPLASYSLYADYYWYELGDMICIGTRDILYYCFPQSGGDVVAKTRLAAEELFRMAKRRTRAGSTGSTKDARGAAPNPA